MQWQKCFPIHEIGRIDGGRGFRTRKNIFRIGRKKFYNRKNKIPMIIPECKRSKIGKNLGIPRNSERISQPRMAAVLHSASSAQAPEGHCATAYLAYGSVE
jgi:hypothetical protein